MTIALDPVVSNIVFSLNLLIHLRRPSASPPWQKPMNNMTEEQLPLVSVLLPMAEERWDSIFATVNCLAAQTYPNDKIEVLFVVEPDDHKSMGGIKDATEFLRDKEIDARVLFTDGNLKIKPHALNRALEEARGEFICVYDADDHFPKDQMMNAVTLMIENGYDCVQPKIFRNRRNSLTGKHLMLDTYTWNRKFLPAFYDTAGVFPLSGEGLYVKRQAILDVGGFPEVITEDAYLAILFAEKGKKFGLLDSELTELAPKDWKSHFRQRVRWFRGYITCAWRTLRSNMPPKQKMMLLIPFLSPFICAFSLFTWIFMALYWLTWAFLPFPAYSAPWMAGWFYPSFILFWSGFLAYIGNPIIMFSLMHSIADTEMERYAPLALTAPFYWMFLGLAATASFFRGSTYWGKTER